MKCRADLLLLAMPTLFLKTQTSHQNKTNLSETMDDEVI